MISHKYPKWMKQKKAEIPNSLDRGTVKVFPKSKVPKGSNILSARFVQSIKTTADGNNKVNVRYVVGGHRDKLKDFMFHSSTTAEPSNFLPLHSRSMLFGFTVWTGDVRQAF